MGWHSNRRCDRAIIACALFVTMAGCGDTTPFPVAEVTGTVTYQSAPLAGGTVVFHPEAATPGPQAMGKIGPDGTFRMKVTDHWGAAVGSHKVTVDYRRELTDEEAQNLVIPDLLIPATYARIDATPLRFTVEADGENICELVLED